MNDKNLHQSIPILQEHPYFIAVQNRMMRIWKMMMHVCQKCLASIKEATAVRTLNPEEGTRFDSMNTESYIDHVFIVLGVLCFTYVVIWYIWKYRKQQRNTRAPSNVTVVSNRIFKKEGCGNLNEVHKILRALKHRLKPVPPSKIPRLYKLHSSKGHRKEALPSRSLSSEELTQNIQIALQLLEKEIDYKNTTAEILSNQEINTSERTVDRIDDNLFVLDNQWNERNSSSEIKQRNIEEWIRNSENYETNLSMANETKNTKYSSNLEEHKGLETHIDYSSHQISPSLHCGNFLSYRKKSPRDYEKQKRFSNSLYSNISPQPNLKRSLSNEHLQESLRVALQILEKEANTENSETNGTLKCQKESISQWRVDGNDIITYRPENQRNRRNINSLNSEMDQIIEKAQVKPSESDVFVSAPMENNRQRSSFYNVVENEDLEACKRYLKTEEDSSLFHHQAVQKKITERRADKKSKDKSFRIRCPEINRLECTVPDLNMNTQPTSTGDSIMNVDESSKQTMKPVKAKDIFNVSADKNALNIKILFNRDIQLSKPL